MIAVLRPCFLILTQETRATLKRCLIGGLRQGIYQIREEDLRLTKSKKDLKKRDNRAQEPIEKAPKS